MHGCEFRSSWDSEYMNMSCCFVVSLLVVVVVSVLVVAVAVAAAAAGAFRFC